MKIKLLKLDDGIYSEAMSKGMTINQFLEDMYAKEAGEESIYQGLSPLEVYRLKKSLKLQRKEIPLDAFEKQLAALDIRAFGPQTDPLAKFFATAAGTSLFPVYVSNSVFAGLMLAGLVPEFAAQTEVVPPGTTVFQKLQLDDAETDRKTRLTSEGQEFPETKIILSDHSIPVRKFGRYLAASYEALSAQKLNVVGLMLQRIGVQIAIDDTDDMINVLINGDGNSNTPGTTVSTITSGTIALADVIGWAIGLPSPYKLDKFVGKKALLAEYYNTLAGMNNPSDQFGFIGISLPRSFEWDRAVYGTSVVDLFVGVDSRYAFLHVTTGAIMTESERLIRKQLQGTAVSYRSGKLVLDPNAVGLFDETHT